MVKKHFFKEKRPPFLLKEFLNRLTGFKTFGRLTGLLLLFLILVLPFLGQEKSVCFSEISFKSDSDLWAQASQGTSSLAGKIDFSLTATSPRESTVPFSSETNWSRLLPQIRQFIEALMKDMGVPGLALALVHDEKPVLIEGFGLRDVDRQLPVTKTTRFILGSTTKAFTTLAMAMLVEEGKMSWDEPVRFYLPEFALKDEWASLRCTARDLVTHRTGLPRHDLVWNGSSLGPEEIVRVLRFLEPSRDFRTGYQYNNLMFITAGVLVSRVAGLPWEDFLKQKIFLPLGMKNSGCTLSEFLASAEYSLAYNRRGEKFEPIPFPSPDKKIMFGPRASGSVFSTAEDMARWLIFQLNEGEIEGKRLISKARFKEMHTPQIVRPANPDDAPEIEHPSYGLGWMIDSYRSHYRVHHSGSTLGFSSYVVLFPGEKFGVAILSNLNSSLPVILANYLSDLALGLKPVDWKKRLEPREPKASSPPKVPFREAKPVRPLADYAGKYSHPAYGEIKIEVNNDRLFLIFREEKVELWPVGPDLFWPKEPSFRFFSIRFQSNRGGAIASVSIPFEPAVNDIIFVKIEER